MKTIAKIKEIVMCHFSLKRQFYSWIIGTLLLSMFFYHTDVEAQVDWTCTSDFYQMFGPPSGPYTFGKLNVLAGNFDLVYTLNDEINALGYNVKDNRIYGVNLSTSSPTREFSRINSDGTITGFGFGVATQSVIAGDCDTSGYWWGFRTGNIIKINLSSGSPTISDLTTISNSGVPSQTADFMYDVVDDAFYGIQKGNCTAYNLIRVNRSSPTIGTSTTITGDIVTYCESGIAGSTWGDKDGVNYFLFNSSGRIYTVDPSGVSTYIMSVTGTIKRNDGTKCVLTGNVFSCSIDDAGLSSETCNDNGTPSNASDDYVSFNLNPTGSNLGSGYTLSVNNGGSFVGGNSGSYGSASSFRLQNGSADGTNFTITITDDTDGSCT
ncbi:MAG: hypothetical protein GY751_24365, partial [Bacteroidetes bacterium]|nr:hypothetical protein [Bacteroidota bacterium]